MNMERAKASGGHGRWFLLLDHEMLPYLHSRDFAVRVPRIAGFYGRGNNRLRRIELRHSAVFAGAEVANPAVLIKRHQFGPGEHLVCQGLDLDEFLRAKGLPADSHRY